jgi:hypothetical protein
VPETKRLNTRFPDRFRWLALLAATAGFLLLVARFHIPGKGFTALINFGEVHAGRYISEIDPKTTYITPDEDGYDSQWYAQLAVAPNIHDPRLGTAIDNLPYRARRILFCWTAHVLGLGQPAWVLEAFALQNLLAWLLLGWLLLRWLPPANWGNVARWLAVMFSFGVAFSLRGSLVDGPGLLLIALGMRLLEERRPWLAAVVMGVSGLGKETCILSGAAPAWPAKPTARDWAAAILRGTVVVAPLALWTGYIVFSFGREGTDSGSRNFALPFTEFWRKAVSSISELCSDPPTLAYTLSGVFAVVSLSTQFLFFALRPRWQDPWWRLGAAYAVLMMCLGEAVWEGYPSAAVRVLLPMLLAFNLTVPRSRRWWIVILLGNITILGTPNFVRLPRGIDPPIIAGDASLQVNPSTAQPVEVSFEGGWHRAERSLHNGWRWTSGPADIVINNPHSFAIDANVSFGLNSRNARAVTLVIAGQQRWSGTALPARQEVTVPAVRLAPGLNRLQLLTDRPAESAPDSADSRALAFRILDLKIELTARAPSP